ncbi:uncharacterized protein LOC108254021, partial [Diaphorina citri]|uniref:Uncharacterized protein LOC108254021 n=1 Tax=Diaphorina citri TaxID=121845 RepID=A0A1S4EQG5_DIACI
MCVSLDLAELSSTVDVFTLTASALYKLVYLLVNMKTLVYIVNVVHYNFEERPIQGLDPFTMSAHIRPTSLLTVIYVLSGQITSVIWCFVPLLFSPVSPVTDPTAPLTLKNRRTMPMNVWLPFNFAYSPAYEIVFVLESFAFFMSALLYLSIDCFYFYLIYIICGQLKLLDASFKTLFTIEENLRRDQEGQKTLVSEKDQLALIKEVEPSWIKDNQKAYRDRILNQHLERIINLHAVVLDLVRLIEVFFSSPIVVDFLHAILSLSFALFQTQ